MKKEDLSRRVQRWIRQYALLEPHAPVVVGISGGPDSVAMAHLLQTLGFRLHLAHLDHGLRPDSREDAALVRQLSRAWNLPLHLERAEVARYADAHGLSLEAAAREVRYRFLFRVARDVGAQAVAVAHTQDDQAETVLLHLLRGSGLTGLQGMRPKTHLWDPAIPLVRPFLGISRQEVLAYCREQNLPYREDPTNRDLRFTRNRIRHLLLPLLEREFHPRVRETLARMARVVQQEVEVLQALTEQAWDRVVQEAGEAFVFWDVSAMRDLPAGVRYHLWRRMALRLRPGLEMTFADVERAEAWLATASKGPVDWFGGMYLAREDRNRGITARWEADLPTRFWPQVLAADQVYPLPWNGEVPLDQGWRLTASEALPVTALPEDLSRTPPHQAWVDADAVGTPLYVRARRPGDRFAPLGMDGHTMKLSDFMINVKIPRRARDRWPLVVHEDTVVWVAGHRLAHPFRVRPQTRRVLRLELLPPTSSPE